MNMWPVAQTAILSTAKLMRGSIYGRKIISAVQARTHYQNSCWTGARDRRPNAISKIKSAGTSDDLQKTGYQDFPHIIKVNEIPPRQRSL